MWYRGLCTGYIGMLDHKKQSLGGMMDNRGLYAHLLETLINADESKADEELLAKAMVHEINHWLHEQGRITLRLLEKPW